MTQDSPDYIFREMPWALRFNRACKTASDAGLSVFEIRKIAEECFDRAYNDYEYRDALIGCPAAAMILCFGSLYKPSPGDSQMSSLDVVAGVTLDHGFKNELANAIQRRK